MRVPVASVTAVALRRGRIELPVPSTSRDPRTAPPEMRPLRARSLRLRNDGRESTGAWAATKPPRYRAVARTLPTSAPNAAAGPGPLAPRRGTPDSTPCGLDPRCLDKARRTSPPTRLPRHDAPARPEGRPGSTEKCSRPTGRRGRDLAALLVDAARFVVVTLPDGQISQDIESRSRGPRVRRSHTRPRDSRRRAGRPGRHRQPLPPPASVGQAQMRHWTDRRLPGRARHYSAHRWPSREIALEVRHVRQATAGPGSSRCGRNGCHLHGPVEPPASLGKKPPLHPEPPQRRREVQRPVACSAASADDIHQSSAERRLSCST